MKTPCDGVDIVIPVYNAANELRRCVESVRTRTEPPYRLILIDDRSPDPAIAQYFAELRAHLPQHWVLLENDRNLGFVGTANRGMALSDNDVVLLNSDTVVTSRWLTKLRRCAASDARIGTVTPFSNNAEICSFPRFCADNPWSELDDPELLNLAMEGAAVPTYPDLPTGVGFCFYIKRELLRRIGNFDLAFGLGYGEENDFCMRAWKAGYRNVLSEDTLVLHLGGRSFDGKKDELGRRNMQLLLERHPEYLARVSEFIDADPLRPIRDAVASRLTALKGHAQGADDTSLSLATSLGAIPGTAPSASSGNAQTAAPEPCMPSRKQIWHRISGSFVRQVFSRLVGPSARRRERQRSLPGDRGA